jgi:prepilin-type N-terminal cleavage/methylation domain-containing protein
MKTLKSQAGVTLSELLTALSVITILLSMSAPSYSEFIVKRKIAGGADLISTFFQNVKMEALKRNEFASVTYKKADDGTNWCLGAVLGKEVACDCMAETPACQIDSVPTISPNESFAQLNDLVAGFNTGTISYDPVRGILTDPEGSVTMQIEHNDEDFRVDISVNAVGSVSKCTPSGHELVGFPTCI